VRNKKENIWVTEGKKNLVASNGELKLPSLGAKKLPKLGRVVGFKRLTFPSEGSK
jgi:hypothetical protein